MNIIIAGCGKVGGALAEQLSQDGHDITVIDQKADVIQKVTNLADVRGIVGNGASYSIQTDAGIENADLLIAVTNSDELNLLCCLIAKKAGNCRTIARVRNPIYHREIRHIKEELGLSMVINPEWAAAMEIARLFRFPSAIEIDIFASGRIELLRFRLEKGPLCGRKLKDIREISKCQVLFCIVERGSQILIPDGEMEIQEADIVSIVATPLNASRFFRSINIETNQVNNVMIIGGGKTTFYLAKKLLEMKIKVKIVEKNREHCEELSELLPEAMIIYGDGTDQELLAEEGLSEAEGFAALTNMDEENVMLSLYAKHMGKAKKVTKVNSSAYHSIIDTLDIGNVIQPKQITADSILQYVRAMQNSIDINVETLYPLAGGRAEAMEFVIREKGPVTDIPLAALELKQSILVCAIYRNEKIIIPNGRDMLMVGDSVVIITTNCGELNDVDDILAKDRKPETGRQESVL